MSNLLYEDLIIAERIGKYILLIFSFFYLFAALIFGFTSNLFPMFANIIFSLIYIYFSFKINKKTVNDLACVIHIVCILYSIVMVYYFGWSFGAQYFLIPCIAFCYVGKFDNRRTIYSIAILESIIFELLYFFMEVQNFSLSKELTIYDKNINGVFYIIHSFIACATIILIMYFIKVKDYKTIELKENINATLSINASTDPLTYLLNRWAFMEKIQLVKPKKPFHFAIIDIDFFKKVNDTYGHNIGDEVLRVTANCIRVSFEKYTDMMARWGGEEFVIFALNCSNEEFYEACNKFRSELNNSKLCGEELKVSASIGCLHIENNFIYSDFDKYIKEVDELLYKAKNSGRNRIVSKST